MDSGMLNAVYDDPFDGNYVKYDNDTEFWSSGRETMGMQLTDALNGILPIAPTEDFHKDDHNAFKYETFAGQQLATGGAMEIITVDPNADRYNTDSEDEQDSESNDGDFNHNGDIKLMDFEHQSEDSNLTFATRTNSSSIGDYESHTSDYDDESDDIIVNNTSFIQNANSNVVSESNNSILDFHTNLIVPDDVIPNAFHKCRTYSTNSLNSDVDGLGLQLDANNFDLTEFITKDDIHISSTTNVSTHPYIAPKTITSNNNLSTNIFPTHSALEKIAQKNNDCDSDSDVIVDVETVEMDEEQQTSSLGKLLKSSSMQDVLKRTEEEAHFIDNIKSDPSWFPTQNAKKVDNHKIEKKSSTQIITRNFPLVPNKKQCDLLKGKFAKAKVKSSHKPLKVNTSKTITMENSPLKSASGINTLNSADNSENSADKFVIGMENKNIAYIKHGRVSISKQISENNIHKKCKNYNNSSLQQKVEIEGRNILNESPAQEAQAAKRKLNLEEYKMRRGGENVGATYKSSNCELLLNKIPKLENYIESYQTNNDKKSAVVNTTPTKHSEAVTSIVKSLREQQCMVEKIVTDPITEAKNKVLRMQELKKAQQMRIIDLTISAKVPKVTKLLPLKEIVKDSPFINKVENRPLNSQSVKSDYEEIIIVSAGCNTDISIPPIPNLALKSVNNATRSLLKSSALLSAITNTFQKVKATDTKLSTSSLIASIQDVVVKKTLPVDVKKVEKSMYHGEDKIIMHLPKERIHKRMCSIGIQTDPQPGFLPLDMQKSSLLHNTRERTRIYRKRQYRKPASSSSSEFSSDYQSDNSDSSTISRSRDNSCSSSERIRTYDSAIGTGGYSSRSSFKYRSSLSSTYSESVDRVARSSRQRRTSYTKRSARKRSRSPYSSSSSYTCDSDRSRSPLYRRSRSRTRSRTRRSSYCRTQNSRNNCLDPNVSQPAVEERRIVYVGRIEQDTTKDMLRRKFLQYGTIKQISIHFKDTGMKYGFVTFERSQDAFAAIDNSQKDPHISMYDVSFGGRRAFCKASYEDLDNAGINTYQSYVFPQPIQQPKEEDSFESLLTKMKAKLNKTNTTSSFDASVTNNKNKANNKI